MIEEVDEMISENEEPNDPVEWEWEIKTDHDADWAVKKIKKAQEDAERWRDYYALMTAKEEDRAARTVAYMKAKLRDYFDRVPHKETKTTEKYPLPSGELILKKPKKVFNHNDSELLDWLKKNGFSEFVKVTEKPDWAGFKKRLTEDSNGIVCDSDTGLVCDVVKTEISDPEFEVK